MLKLKCLRSVGKWIMMLLVSLGLLAAIHYCEITYSARHIPILMLHSVSTEPAGDWSITTDNLREDIQYMQEQGYTIVSLKQVIAFGTEGKKLPEKCVCLTFDDGYYDNYEKLMPLLEELQVPATVFVITERLRTPDETLPSDGSLAWMSPEEVQKLNECQWIDVQSHTYDLHSETIDPDSGMTRTYILPLEGESEEHYLKVLRQDYEKADAILKEAGIERQFALAYPHGEGNSVAEEFLKEQGIQLTLTTDAGHNNLVEPSHPETLFSLGRMNLNDDTTKENLMAYLEG